MNSFLKILNLKNLWQFFRVQALVCLSNFLLGYDDAASAVLPGLIATILGTDLALWILE